MILSPKSWGGFPTGTLDRPFFVKKPTSHGPVTCMRRLCGGYAAVMVNEKRLKNGEKGEAAVMRRLCGGYAAVMRRLSCGQVAVQIPSKTPLSRETCFS